MSNRSNLAVRRKVTVTRPDELLMRLDARVPSRQRSSFIAQAIETQLALAEQQATIEETVGAWSDANHPDMMGKADMDTWLQALRHSWGRTTAVQHNLTLVTLYQKSFALFSRLSLYRLEMA